MLTARAANASLGDFSGDLANNQAVESAINVGSWHHVVLAANATTCVFSVDGVAIASGRCEANNMFWWSGGTEIVVGGFVGWVDDVAIHAGARPSQVSNACFWGGRGVACSCTLSRQWTAAYDISSLYEQHCCQPSMWQHV